MGLLIKCPKCNADNEYITYKGFVCKHCGYELEKISFKCGCGNKYDYIPYHGYVCSNCGKKHAVIESEYIDKLNTAITKRLDEYDFESSLKICNELLEKFPDNQEALWGALMAEYAVVDRERGDARSERVPTFLAPDKNKTPINLSKYYQKLDDNRKRLADEIEKVRKNVLEQYERCPSYDVFICYKKHKLNKPNALTPEAEKAKEFYELLKRYRYVENDKQSKLRVFYADACLGKNNASWEPHIYKALTTAKAMVVLCSSEENVNSGWVKNEWMRFYALGQMDSSKKDIIPVLVNGAPADILPYPLNKTQSLDITGKDWKQDFLEKRIRPALIANIPAIFEEARANIIKNRFGRAKKNYKDILSRFPDNAMAHWGLLKCRLKAFDDYDLVAHRRALTAYEEFQLAYDKGNADEKKYFEKIQKAQTEHNLNGYSRENRELYLRTSKPVRTAKKVFASLCACAVLAFSIYSVIGAVYPVNYKTEDGKAVVTGKSIYFNVAVKELEIDIYKNKPVTSIEAGAFKNSAVLSVTLGEYVESIGERAFENNKKLKEVNIASECPFIGERAFKNCYALTSFNLGVDEDSEIEEFSLSGLSVGKSAFENCYALKSLQLNNIIHLGSNAFGGCFGLKELTLDILSGATFEEGALDNVPKGITVRVPTVAERALATLKNSYPSVNFATYTRDKTEECIYFIDKIKTVKADSAEDIAKAEALYNALSDEEKKSVTNYNILKNAKEALNAANAISAIGKVTLESGQAILKAETAYKSLSAEQRELVENYNVLVDARAIFDTMTLIDVIGEVEPDSETKIKRAEQAYSALTEKQRAGVSNYGTLSAARNKVDILLSAAVMEKINAIGSVISIDSEESIIEAETAYGILTQAQKNKVTNYDKLVDARCIYDAVKAIDNIGTITAESSILINIAKTLYDELNPSQKSKICNYSELTDAIAVYPVITSINSIGAVMPESGSVIESIEAEYANLSSIRKTKVSNYKLLSDARAAYAVVCLIDEIKEVVAENGLSIQGAENAYDGLTEEQKLVVGNYSRLKDLVGAYAVFTEINKIDDLVSAESAEKIESAERAYGKLTSAQKNLVSNYVFLVSSRAVYDVVFAIDNIGTITVDSVNALNTADNLYSDLNAELKNRVSNSEELSDAQAVYPVVKKIGEITVVLPESSSLIEEIQAEYTKLNIIQQNKVSNYAVIADARKAYTAVIIIDGIKEVTVNSGADIERAGNAYESLSPEQKVLVGNYADYDNIVKAFNVVIEISKIETFVSPETVEQITVAEREYSKLTAAQKRLVSNFALLKEVLPVYKAYKAIDDIGVITADSGEAIEAAESSYDSLTHSQQLLVGNYYLLQDAKTIFGVISAVKNIGRVTLDSLSEISAVESMYNALTEEQKLRVVNREELSLAHAIYNVMTVVASEGSFTLSKGTNYNYLLLNSANMVEELNNAKRRAEIDGLTVSGYKQIDYATEVKFRTLFKNFNIVRYNVSSVSSGFSEFKVASTSKRIGLIGDRNKTYSNFKIVFESRTSNVYLELCNFNMTAASNTVAINCNDVNAAYTTELAFSGTCSVRGGNGRAATGNSAATNGCSAIVGKNILIRVLSAASVEISGGKGGTGIGSPTQGVPGDTGGAGGCAIQADDSLEVVNNATLIVRGGQGGTGGTGKGYDYNSNWATGKNWAKSGSLGGTGGAGGTAVKSPRSEFISYGELYLYGGAGGTGGVGGNGQGSYCDGAATAGHGGKGGTGGIGGTAIHSDKIILNPSSNAKINVIAGNGGFGGKGGRGGWAKNDGKADDGGNGGDGGIGGAGGTAIEIKNVSDLNGYSAGVSIKGGKGSKGGDGGVGGDSYYSGARYGNSGDGGDGGKSGDGGKVVYDSVKKINYFLSGVNCTNGTTEENTASGGKRGDAHHNNHYGDNGVSGVKGSVPDYKYYPA